MGTQMTKFRTVAILAAGLIVLTGCNASNNADPGTVITGTRTVTSTLPPPAVSGPSVSQVQVTVTVTDTPSVPAASTTKTTKPTKATDAPAAPLPAQEAGDCPYISNEFAAIANGQGVGQTMIRPTKPYVVCDFYRSDGGWSGSIRVAVAKDAAAATALIDYAAPIKKSNPASVEGGWNGGSWVKELGADPLILNDEELAVFAVSKGKVAIIATSNEALTKKARNFVVEAIANLKL